MSNLNRIKQKIKRLKNKLFFNSGNYWNQRYKKGGNSGPGSYGKLAEFKGEVINSFIKENNINNVVEFGCGDGNQLHLLLIQNYSGFDVSFEAINICKNKFSEDPTKTFKHLSDYRAEKAELVLSLDVIFHLVEDNVFEKYMKQLFNAAEKKVIIYSSNFEDNNTSAHVKHRKFTDWIESNIKGFNLVAVVPNRYPFNGNNEISSFADFYFYSK
ncbi:methyltransferase domain-containing protein [Shivajiella indica]|uniref:Methyltransferase domain-containing protein n=1 Tax=Shivajiella indica TaxID=872115 RepID=A0ABW5BCP7_9BACT